MHPLETRAQFLRLRAGGFSLGSISRRLGVSKPTLIAWSREAQPHLQAAILADQQQRDSTLASSTNQELTDLKRRLGFVRQELFSRDMREFSTPTLEKLAGQLTDRIQQIESLTNAAPVPNQNSKIKNQNCLSAPETAHQHSPASVLKPQQPCTGLPVLSLSSWWQPAKAGEEAMGNASLLHHNSDPATPPENQSRAKKIQAHLEPNPT